MKTNSRRAGLRPLARQRKDGINEKNVLPTLRRDFGADRERRPHPGSQQRTTQWRQHQVQVVRLYPVSELAAAQAVTF